jgi:molybdopterin molybdotransferase
LGENVVPAGIDFAAEEEIIHAGRAMTARLVGLASTMHVLWVPVVRKPRVGVLAIGSELAMPGEANVQNPITASSLYSFSADIIACGGEPVILGISSDAPEAIQASIRAAEGCDLLVTTGGTSPSAGTLMQDVLNAICSEVEQFKIELNRNDYMLYGRLGTMPVCALPGNPISSRIYFSVMVSPLITRLGGMKPPAKTFAILGRTVDEHDTSVAYLHASLSVDESGAYKVIPVSAQDGFLLSELAKSDCLMAVNQNKALKKGDFVEIIPYGRGINNT